MSTVPVALGLNDEIHRDSTLWCGYRIEYGHPHVYGRFLDFLRYGTSMALAAWLSWFLSRLHHSIRLWVARQVAALVNWGLIILLVSTCEYLFHLMGWLAMASVSLAGPSTDNQILKFWIWISHTCISLWCSVLCSTSISYAIASNRWANLRYWIDHWLLTRPISSATICGEVPFFLERLKRRHPNYWIIIHASLRPKLSNLPNFNCTIRVNSWLASSTGYQDCVLQEIMFRAQQNIFDDAVGTCDPYGRQ